jgi:alkyl hydroperoxide reductase subunit AhpC
VSSVTLQQSTCGTDPDVTTIQEAAVMSMKIGDTAPDFQAETSEGTVRFHDWLGESWAVLFSHPRDFTPVCTTELGYLAHIKAEFDRRNVKIIGLSVDPVSNHAKWANDIAQTQGRAPNYPIIGDADYQVSKLYGMLPAEVDGGPLTRTPADNQTVRNVFVIGPDKKVKLILVYPMTTGRNFDEVLRVIDSLQLTAQHRVATPVNWKQGEDVIIAGSVSDAEAKTIYPAGWRAPARISESCPPHADRLLPNPAGTSGSETRKVAAVRAIRPGPAKRDAIPEQPPAGVVHVTGTFGLLAWKTASTGPGAADLTPVEHDPS